VSREPAMPRNLKPSVLENLIDRYEHNPRLRALVAFIGGHFPPLDTLEAAVVTSFQKIQSERLRELFDALDQGGIPLTDELIQQEQFVHAFVATARAASRTRQRQKIRLFSQLLRALADHKNGLDGDEHEELLRVLEELSPREFASLVLLRNHEQATERKSGETTPQWILRFWEGARHDLEQNLGIPTAELEGWLARLSRTGFYRREIGFLGEAKEIGCTTPNLTRFLAVLDADEGTILPDPASWGAETGVGSEG